MDENTNGVQTTEQPQQYQPQATNMPGQVQYVAQSHQYGFTLPFAKSLARWATFRAVMDILIGALSCIGIITAAYGVVQIISGVKLLGAVDNLKRQAMSNDPQDIFNALTNFNQYFRFSGIAMIIKIAMAVLAIFFYIAIIAYVVTQLPDLLKNLPHDGGRYF